MFSALSLTLQCLRFYSCLFVIHSAPSLKFDCLILFCSLHSCRSFIILVCCLPYLYPSFPGFPVVPTQNYLVPRTGNPAYYVLFLVLGISVVPSTKIPHTYAYPAVTFLRFNPRDWVSEIDRRGAFAGPCEQAAPTQLQATISSHPISFVVSSTSFCYLSLPAIAAHLPTALQSMLIQSTLLFIHLSFAAIAAHCRLLCSRSIFRAYGSSFICR